MDERKHITLGALFHDIGKVIQRSSYNPRKKTHQEFGAEWIRGHLSDKYKELADFALYHHFNPGNHPELDVRSQYRNDLLLVAHADNLSSGERERDYTESTFDLMRPLSSIFSTIETGKGNKSKDAFYRPAPLSKGIFYPEKKFRLTSEDYKQILKDFENAIPNESLHPNSLLDILEEYFSLIPSHTAEAEGKGTDVSLFDHLKTTAAIALAAYNYLVDTHKNIQFSQIPSYDIADTKTKRYLLIGVDVSGIQNFIYTITSKGALKLLRARSFYVEMLLEFIAMKLLKDLKLFRTNLLFLGGGNFIILAQNTENARKRLELIIHDFNAGLFDEHHGRLWLTHGMIEFSGEIFLTRNSQSENTISEILEKLRDKIDEAKFHKFSSFDKLGGIFEPQKVEGHEECEVCGAEVDVRNCRIGDEEHRFCRVCENLYHVGSFIHKAKYIVYYPNSRKTQPLGELSIHRGEKLSLYSKDDSIDGEFVWTINPSGDEHIGHGVKLYLGNYPQMGRNFDPDIEDKDAPSFNYFGLELVGTLRMDVDNLGYIFSKGIPKEKRSISRLAMLSRFFNLFFRRFINDIARGELGGLKQFSVVHPAQTAPRETVVVYAGGDDLFIVGAWHDVIELAFDIRKAFRKFIGGDHITISGGIAVNHVKHPIHLFAANSGEAEEKSKGYGGNEKDALTLFDHTMQWKDWENIIEKEFLLPVRKNFYGDVKAIAKEDDRMLWGSKLEPSYLPAGGELGELKRAVIYKLMWISNELKEKGLKLKPLALLTYLITRSEVAPRKTLRQVEPFKKWINILEFWKIVGGLKPALMWLDLMIREQEKEKI